MNKAITAAALLATLALAACNNPATTSVFGPATAPPATGASSSAPNAQNQATGGGVGSANTSSHTNGGVPSGGSTTNSASGG